MLSSTRERLFPHIHEMSATVWDSCEIARIKRSISLSFKIFIRRTETSLGLPTDLKGILAYEEIKKRNVLYVFGCGYHHNSSHTMNA